MLTSLVGMYTGTVLLHDLAAEHRTHKDEEEESEEPKPGASEDPE